jgi:predicted transcriptional regulator
MKTALRSQTVTLRLPTELYRQTSELARQRNQSVNALLQESIQRMLKENSNKVLSDAFDLLAAHHDECDVEYALPAQSEVVLRDEP